MLFRHWTEKFELYPYRVYTEEAVCSLAACIENDIPYKHKSMGAVCRDSRVHGSADPCPRLAPLLNMIIAWRKWPNQSVALTFAAVVKVSVVVGNRVDVVRFCLVRNTPPNLPGFAFRDRRILRCELYEIFLRTLSICQQCKNKISSRCFFPVLTLKMHTRLWSADSRIAKSSVSERRQTKQDRRTVLSWSYFGLQCRSQDF